MQVAGGGRGGGQEETKRDEGGQFRFRFCVVFLPKLPVGTASSSGQVSAPWHSSQTPSNIPGCLDASPSKAPVLLLLAFEKNCGWECKTKINNKKNKAISNSYLCVMSSNIAFRKVKSLSNDLFLSLPFFINRFCFFSCFCCFCCFCCSLFCCFTCVRNKSRICCWSETARLSVFCEGKRGGRQELTFRGRIKLHGFLPGVS